MRPPTVRFTYDQAAAAGDEWGLNCGPAAIAAICGLTLDELRPHLGDFEQKRYTNPTLMGEILAKLGAKFGINYWIDYNGTVLWPRYGLARIQWEGPWTKEGVPIRVRYRHTHWVGCCSENPQDIGIFDVNCLNNGTGWVALSNWEQIIVPHILCECEPGADGRWHITHSIEVRR